MMDATRRPQSVLVLGGGSDIAAATLRRWARGPLRRVHLGVRDPASAPPIVAELSDCEVSTFAFDAAGPAAHLSDLDAAFEEAGDVDVALIAFGVLGDQRALEDHPAGAEEMVTINAAATIVASLALSRRMTEQGHGVIVVMSSVAGQRPRRDNYVYGATKAAVDAHARGLAAALEGTGVEVVVVRPGFVHTKMTRDMAAAPLSVSVEEAAKAIVRGVRRRKGVVWVPWTLGPLLAVLRLLPEPLWRRLVQARMEGPAGDRAP